MHAGNTRPADPVIPPKTCPWTTDALENGLVEPAEETSRTNFTRSQQRRKRGTSTDPGFSPGPRQPGNFFADRHLSVARERLFLPKRCFYVYTVRTFEHIFCSAVHGSMQIQEEHILKRITCLVVLILFNAAMAAQAQVTVIYSSGAKQYFSMAIPDGWRVNVGTEQDLSRKTQDRMESARLISTMPNNGTPLWFGMWVTDDLANIEGAREYVASLGLDLLADVNITERKHTILNSMAVQYVSGTGNKEGEIMDFRAGFFQLSPGQVAIALYIGPPETTLKHGEELAQMIQSLQSLIQ